jgi:4-amino-4-deoxy-L-arabinose transferase-like glycosyltransferase
MIIEVFSDMRYFLLILILVVFGFSHAMAILGISLKKQGFTEVFGTNLFESFTFMYELVIGEFQTSGFKGHQWLLWSYLVMSTMFIMVVLLNLLIAIISDTFERVQER